HKNLNVCFAPAYIHINEINRSDSLLPNVSIGYRIYDSCGSRLSSMSATMALMNGHDIAAEERCDGQSPIHAIIGETESSTTVILNRKHYTSFFRTIASDYHQSRALAQIVKHFGWSWVGAVNSDNDYGNNGMTIFLTAAQEEKICVEYSVKFYRTETEKLKKVVDTIKKGTAKVIVAFLSHFEMGNLLDELSIENITDLQVIGVEAWITAKSLITPSSFRVLGGALGFAVRKINIEGFADYIINEFWDTAFPCSQMEGNYSQFSLNCNGFQDLFALKKYKEDVLEQSYSSNVYKAVYALAHSLHIILNCKEKCGSENVTVPLHKQDSDGSVKFKPVGYYDASLPPDQRFVLNTDNIIWARGQLEKPTSVCSESCPPGTRKATQKGRPVCCYDCIPCAEGEISNKTVNCKQCPEEYWSNAERNNCVFKVIEFLSFTEIMGIVLVFFSLFGVGLTVLVAILFYNKKDTPIVKANNSELSFLLLFSLTLCFLCSLTFIGQPTEWSCMLRHTVFGITFVLCISCVLGKTVVVLMAFKATLPGSNVMKCFGPKQQRLSVLAFTLIQVLICVLWLTLSPPLPYKNIKYFHEKIILECTLGSTIAFSAVMGYIGLLAILSKFITFSMLIFCAVWITFIPAYISSPGKFTVAVEIFAILASSFGLLFCIFAPKCYIILCKPDQNAKQHMMGKFQSKPY
uniref:G-protein coupled receptors family 3 profile domain-containing protein n=1 Tax=Cyprinus carpio carpio TaxID=630221 RepID=A0A9J7X5P3_CYPCA